MKRALAVFLGMGLMLVPAASLGQGMARSVCGEREEIVSILEDQFGETPVALALEKSGMAVEILKSKAGTWTLLFSQPDGRACVIEYGQAWQSIEVAADADNSIL